MTTSNKDGTLAGALLKTAKSTPAQKSAAGSDLSGSRKGIAKPTKN